MNATDKVTGKHERWTVVVEVLGQWSADAMAEELMHSMPEEIQVISLRRDKKIDLMHETGKPFKEITR